MSLKKTFIYWIVILKFESTLPLTVSGFHMDWYSTCMGTAHYILYGDRNLDLGLRNWGWRFLNRKIGKLRFEVFIIIGNYFY